MALLFGAFLMNGQISESFENLSGSYTTGIVSLSSGDWNVKSVYPEASNASRTGSKAARINDDTSNAHITTPALTGGIGNVTFFIEN